MTTVINSTPKRFVIDRLFVSDDSWWIVDFKTSAPATGITTEHFVAEETQRYRGQLVQYKTVLEALIREQPEYLGGASIPQLANQNGIIFHCTAQT